MQTAGSLIALAALVLIPGGVLLWRGRRDGFATAADGTSMAAALLFGGMGIICAALWPAFMLLGPTRAGVIAGLATAVGVVAVAPTGRSARRGASANGSPAPIPRAVIAAACASVVLVAAPFFTHGVERGHLVHPVAMTDWEKHVVVSTGIATADRFPPPHPYVRTVESASYHYGYQLLAAGAAITADSDDVFGPLLLLTLITAAATPFVVYALAAALFGGRAAVLAAVGATLLTGLDLLAVVLEAVRSAVTTWPLPVGFAAIRAIVPSSNVDFWIHNVDRQFSAPLVATMWAPHNVAAALLALLAFVLLGPRPGALRQPRAGFLLPGLLIGALPALSAYVAIMFAAGITAAMLQEAIVTRTAPHRTDMFGRWIGAGIVAAVVAAPVYPTLSAGSSSGLILAVSESGNWTNGAIFNALFGSNFWTNLLDTPAVLLFDFGAIGVLALAGYWQRRQTAGRLDGGARQAMVAAITILAIAVVVRPPLGIGNNLYARGLLLAWLLLAPFAAAAVPAFRRRRVLGALVLVGALGSGYAVAGNVGEALLFKSSRAEDVEVMRWINAERPRREVVAFHPDEYTNDLTYWLRRPVVLANRRLAALFGASPEEITDVESRLKGAYAATAPEEAARRFDELGARTILVRPPSYRLREDAQPLAVPPATWESWALSPCFEVAHRTPAWLVITRLDACGPT